MIVTSLCPRLPLSANAENAPTSAASAAAAKTYLRICACSPVEVPPDPWTPADLASARLIGEAVMVTAPSGRSAARDMVSDPGSR